MSLSDRWAAVESRLFFGGTCLLVSIYIAIQGSMFASVLTLYFGQSTLACIVLVLSATVIVSQYFEPFHMSSSARKSQTPHFYRYLMNGKIVTQPNGSHASTPIWTLPQSREYEAWHPLAPMQCVECNSTRPPRARHCHDCEMCKPGWDHHCAFVNACIDESNFPAFYCFLLWAFYMLLASKLLDLYMVVVWLVTYQPPASESDFAVLQSMTGFLANGALESIKNIGTMNKFLLGINCLLGICVACFIAKMLFEQTCNLVLNATSTERTKYARCRMPIPFNYMHFGGKWQIFKNLYKNAAFRVWQGPKWTSRYMPIFDESNHKKFGAVDWADAIHVLACYTIPQYWRWSGEARAHRNANILAKHGIMPNNQDWTKHASQITR